MEIKTKKKLLAMGEACMSIILLTCSLGFKGRTFVSSELPTVCGAGCGGGSSHHHSVSAAGKKTDEIPLFMNFKHHTFRKKQLSVR